MKRSKRWIALIAVLALTALCGGGALADNGDKQDPLVTQSYLEQTVIPQVVEQVEEKAQVRRDELVKSLEEQIGKYKEEVAAMAGSVGSAGGESSSASYTLVTLTKGQTMAMEVGCEVMLRVGSASVSCGTNPALIDISTGGTLNKGVGLTKNHLYMATIPDRVLNPTADTVKVLVRGGYTVNG